MTKSLASAGYPAENINLGLGQSIVSMGHVAKDIDWRDKVEIRELLQQRFAASSLPFETRLRIYTELMMVLSVAGIVFSIGAKGDLGRLRRGVDIETIHEILLPEMDYKIGTC